MPADLIATWIAHWSIFSGYQDDPAVRSILVSYSTNILLNVLTALIAFRLLRQLRFEVRESVWGVLALLFCTTHLHYTQNMQENNYIMLLTLVGLSFQYEWLRTRNRRALWIGSAALGLNLLTRVTTGLDVMAAGVFLLLVVWFEEVRGREVWARAIAYCKVAVPVYILFALIERLYSYYRFGSLTQTYIPIFARESRMQDPRLPANFPWSTPLHEGVLGALFKPEKSIFLFDPLLILALLLFVVLWKRMTPGPRLRTERSSSACRLHLLLCALHILGGRFRLGRSLCLDRGGDGRAPLHSAAAALSGRIGSLDAARGLPDCGKPCDSGRIADVLAAAGDLSDGNAGAPDVRDRAAVQEHRRFRSRQK